MPHAAPAPDSCRASVRNHVSIDTHDLARARAFYRALLDHEPAVARHDYLRFVDGASGLVLGLNARPGPARDTGPVRHLGLLFARPEELVAARARLEQAGFPTHGAARTTCCYAELDQYWARDPSGVSWELFWAHREVVPADTACSTSTECCGSAQAS